ncbi:MAG: ABC transporter substrate-binding protein [Oscillospiraceae bacterium]|nr:ABC transporter substrate-binding protein [Oscillospiraceae bacterium]
MKKLISLVLALILCLSLAACGGSGSGGGKKNFTVGICQLVQHPALDAATKGFRDALEEAMPGQITFDEKNASGDAATCATIVNGFVAGNVDLILANATPALQAASSATQSIPVLGTAITEYGVALDIANFSGTVGGNVSGTSDLAPLDQQAAMFDELLPAAKRIGILYCSAEANSVYQAQVVKAVLESAGKTVTIYTFADSNDVGAVTAQACGENDALYIPTDNTAASSAEAINNVAEPAGVPIICGEEGICTACGVATLSIDYYELGRTTGAMAAKILKGESKISEMPIEYFQGPVKKFNAAMCAELGVAVPEGYEVIE